MEMRAEERGKGGITVVEREGERGLWREKEIS